MEEKKFLYADRIAQFKKINRFLAVGILVFCVVTIAIVTGSCINGYRSWTYFGVLLALMIALNVTDFVLLKKSRDGRINRYIAFAGMMILTFFIVWAYNSDYMRFMALIPFIGTIMYYDTKFSALAAVSVTGINFVTMFIRVYIMKQFTGGDGEKKKAMGFEITPAMMKMLGGFTVLRAMNMAGSANVTVTKEQLLALNEQLNKIKK